jgi:hypothetical protein
MKPQGQRLRLEGLPSARNTHQLACQPVKDHSTMVEAFKRAPMDWSNGGLRIAIGTGSSTGFSHGAKIHMVHRPISFAGTEECELGQRV